MLEWKPLTLDDRLVVSDYLQQYPPQVSEHTFTNLFIWGEHRTVRFAEVDDTLLVMVERNGRRSLHGPPVGPQRVSQLMDALEESGIHRFERIPERTAQELNTLGLVTKEDRDNSDYVYRQRDLAELRGRRYHRQKNLINRCVSRNECRYCEITIDMLDEVAQMQDRWCDERDCGKDRGLCAEYRAIRRMLGDYEELRARGAAVRVGDRIEAFTMGEALNPSTAVIHFEKAMAGIPGLYQVINKWFVKRDLEEFEFVNREQDLGIPGLRQAKESYSPDHMTVKYVAAFEPANLEPLVSPAEGRCPE